MYFYVEQKILVSTDEQLNIVALKSTIVELNTKIDQCQEEKSYLTKKYQMLKQQYLNMVFLILGF